MTGQKDTVSMMIDGERALVQKRLLLFGLDELFVLFQEYNPKCKIGFSTFAKLRPKNCILAGANGTHCVCVCTIHENCRMRPEAINIGKLTNGQICTYKDCINRIVCEIRSPKCYLNKCNDCPDGTNFYLYLAGLLNDACIHEVEFTL